MLILYLALILAIVQAQNPLLKDLTFPESTVRYDADLAYLQDDMLENIAGIFYSGGGYASHGEGAGLTWGWNKYFNQGKGLADLFSDMTVSSNSGGGWFFNDVLYSKKFVELIEEPSPSKYRDLIGEYYYELISEIYNESIDKIKRKTERGSWDALDLGDYVATFLFENKVDSWEQLVLKFHYMYPEEPILPLKNCNWTSLFGLAEDYNEYYLVTNIEAIDDPQKSSWHKAVPGFLEYTFESGLQKPEIEVQIPVLDNWYSAICSIRKTNRECTADADCMDNAYCDTKWSLCICSHGYTSLESKSSDYCRDCTDVDPKSDWIKPSGVKSIDVFWEKTLKKDPMAKVSVDRVKELIFDSINDPKKFSGPSSCAAAAVAGDVSSLQTILSLLGMEGSWQTARLQKEFDDSDAPRLSLIDGGAEDNCGITGMVRRMQASVPKEEIGSLKATIIGMCSMPEVAMLISDMTGDNPKLYEVFEFRNINEPAQKQWSKEVMEVWGFKVRTLYEPTNGILPGSEFNIFAFSFPDTTPRQGICRSYGLGDCENNVDKKEEDIKPLMSLLIGRGEVPELQIASQFILDDMTALAEDLGLIEPIEPQTFSIYLNLNEVLGTNVSDFALYILATIGFCFVAYSLMKKKASDFTPIAAGSEI